MKVETLIVGCGYLGFRVAERLAALGRTVAGTTRSESKLEPLRAAGITPVIFDVTDPDPAAWARLPEAERVLYSVAVDRKEGDSPVASYADGLARILGHYEARTPVVFTSTTGVYGDAGGDWVDEFTPADPSTDSAWASLMAECHLEARGGPGIALRLAGLYGPGRVVGRSAVEGGGPIDADAEGWVNLLQVDDAATAAILALDRLARDSEPSIYNVTDGNPIRRRDLYELAARAAGAPSPTFAPSGRGGRGSSDRRVRGSRFAEDFGFTPEYLDVRRFFDDLSR